jgi:hypothetical protein
VFPININEAISLGTDMVVDEMREAIIKMTTDWRLVLQAEVVRTIST